MYPAHYMFHCLQPKPACMPTTLIAPKSITDDEQRDLLTAHCTRKDATAGNGFYVAYCAV